MGMYVRTEIVHDSLHQQRLQMCVQIVQYTAFHKTFQHTSDSFLCIMISINKSFAIIGKLSGFKYYESIILIELVVDNYRVRHIYIHV